ncbi:hypothetical protein D6777_04815 [Candidatus Woesearchaeota archaeon]|nr:MAG: hypothetical protein D6777_04815 [Candidatus Woesearchaeota archaeon]
MQCLICKKPLPFNSKKRLCKEHSSPQYLFKPVNLLKGNELEGTSPSVFVGEYGYPHVNVGILSPPVRDKNAWIYDSPTFWASEDFGKSNILSLRSSLINSKFNVTVKQQSNKLLELAQELTLSLKPTDVDISLSNKPKSKLNFDNINLPHGPQASLLKAELSSNPSVNKKIEKTVYDTDFKSSDALSYLYKNKIDENSLIKLLSIGNLGIKSQRKLVPTKWSITAVHDNLGKFLLNKVKDNDSTGYRLYFSGYLHNYFLILFFPDVWSYELFETYVGSSLDYTTDHEFYDGRTSYASNCVGGYYASRLAVLEKLNSLRRQAKVLVLRFTELSYDTPLGVWVVLEAVRKCLSTKGLEFSSKEEMLDSARKIIYNKFRININYFLNKSKILEYINNQKRLFQYF